MCAWHMAYGKGHTANCWDIRLWHQYSQSNYIPDRHANELLVDAKTTSYGKYSKQI